MEYIHTTQFYWTLGILLTILSGIVGYWIKEIKSIGSSLESHKTEDEKEFQEMIRANDNAHAQIRQDMNTKTDDLSKGLAVLSTKLDTLIEAVRELKRK